MTLFIFSSIQVKTVFLPTEKSMTLEACAPLIATLPLEVCFYIVPKYFISFIIYRLESYLFFKFFTIVKSLSL